MSASASLTVLNKFVQLTIDGDEFGTEVFFVSIWLEIHNQIDANDANVPLNILLVLTTYLVRIIKKMLHQYVINYL